MPRTFYAGMGRILVGAVVSASALACAHSSPPATASAPIKMNPEQESHHAGEKAEFDKDMPFEPMGAEIDRPFDGAREVTCSEADTPDTPDGRDAAFLFVQSADNVSTSGSTLTLHNVSPDTAYFSDRPTRLAGRISTAEWVRRWSSGPDSFASNPPNASLACQDGAQSVNAVVELESPQLSDNNLSYRVLALDGVLPASCQSARLFTDSGACTWCEPGAP